MFRRVKKRYPGPQEKKMTVGPGFLQKTGLAEEKICSGPVLHRKSTILTGKIKKNGSKTRKILCGTRFTTASWIVFGNPGESCRIFF